MSDIAGLSTKHFCTFSYCNQSYRDHCRVWAVDLKMVEEAVALNQQVHHGAPNSSYDMTAVMKMCWAVEEA